MGLFSSSSGSYLGIDIGSSSIKMVELTKEKGQAKLLTYGFSEHPGEGQEEWQNNTKYIAKAIGEICKKAAPKSKNAVSALPTFSVFSSIINLSNIGKKDIASAVHWEAKKVVPLPLEEMIATDQMDAARAFFLPLSSIMIETVQRFGTAGAGELKLAFCPMADDDNGADWLQFGDDIRNPYFGSEMLMCGEVIRTLSEEK